MTQQERFRKPFAEVMKTSLIRPVQLLFSEPIIFLFSVSLDVRAPAGGPKIDALLRSCLDAALPLGESQGSSYTGCSATDSLFFQLIYCLLYLLFFAVPIVWGEIHGFPLGSGELRFVSRIAHESQKLTFPFVVFR